MDDWENSFRSDDFSEHIAIIGMTGRFPGAKNTDEFWRNLRDGVESISFFSAEDLARSNIERSLLNDPRYVGADGVIEDMDMFDAEFFNITPREAELMDPQHRLFLECAWELIELAGYDSESYDGRVAIYGSANLSTYLIRNIMSNPDLRETATSFQTMITNDKDFVATRASYKMNLTGPSMSVATLCSSGCVAVHLACQALLNYQCDLALAGAISLQASRSEAFFYQEGGIGDPDGHCRAFDAKASGTVSGSGIGLVALRRLEDALADGDHIHAVIRGTAVNNDGSVKYSYTAPSIEGQAGVIAEAISLAEVDPETITYVETHGTGTRLGDPIEVSALTKAFRGSGAQGKQYCAIGSVKTNIGHLVNAGGVASLIKTVLAMQHGQIPASLNFEEPNPEIDFENSPFFVNTELREWKADGYPRRAGVSSFGIGGTNVHVVVEEAPEIEPSGESRPWQLLVLSAKTSTALEKQTKNLLAYLERQPHIDLADVAFTLQVGRRAFEHRRVLLCRDREDAITALRTRDPERVLTRFQESHGRPVAFVFPGLGEQRLNVGLELYRGEPTFREQMDVCAEVLNPTLGFDLRQVLYPDAEDAEEARQRLEQPTVARSALFALEYCLAKLWEEWGIRPQVMIGDGVGEYVAACLAGVLTLEGALALAVADGLGQAELTNLNPPRVPLISGVTGVRITDGEATDPAYWTARIPQATRFAEGLEQLSKQSEQVLLGVGPGQVLGTSAADHLPGGDGQIVLSSMCRQNEGRSGLAFLLTTLGRLWLAGAKVEWNGFHTYEQRHRIPLPTYPFERKHYWVEPVKPEDQLSASRVSREELLTTKRPDIADWFYIPSWRRSLSPVGTTKASSDSCWLLFIDECGVGGQLVDRLKREKQRVAVVKAGPQFTKLGNDTFALNPGRQLEYVALLNELNAAGMPPERIVHLWSVTQSYPEIPTEEGIDQAQELGFYSLLLLVQALGVRRITDELQLAVVSNRLQEVTVSDKVCPEKATLLGAVKVIPQEYPNVTCRSIDVVLPEPGTWQEKRLIDRLWTELAHDSEDRAIAYRGHHRWVQTFEPVRLDKLIEASSRLREGGAYLILGGLEGIGRVFAEHLAQAIRAKLVLTKDPGAPIGKPAGLEALVLDVDVTDRGQVEAAVAQAEARFGQLNGVVYAAGEFGRVPFHSIAETDRTECERRFQATVYGPQILAQALSGKELDFCLLTSSLSSVLGGPGLVTYAAANAFVDALARQNDHTSATLWISVNWDSWEPDTQSGGSSAVHADELSITSTEGVEAFERILSCDGATQLAVSTVDLQARIERWVKLETVRGRGGSSGRKMTVLHTRPNLMTSYIAPRDEVEQTLADIWQELIGVEQVGIHDNFVELGGDSLLGVQVVARANEAGLCFTPQQFFQHQTIAELAAVEGTVSIQAEQGIVTGRVPLTVAQRFFFDQEYLDPNRWNFTTLFEVPSDMDHTLLERVTTHILAHHDALRARFVREESEWRQFIVEPDGKSSFVCIDISKVPEEEQRATIEQASESLHQGLLLSEAPLMRVASFKLGAGRKGRLLITVHHLVLDGISAPILLEDFQTAYQQLARGEPIQLPSKTTSLKRWAERLEAYGRSTELRQELDYWLTLPWEEVPPLPVDYPAGRECNTVTSTRSVMVRLSVEETNILLQKVPQLYNAKVTDALLMALGQALTRWAGGKRTLVNVVDFGRRILPDAGDMDSSRTMGLLSLHGSMMLERVKATDSGEALEQVKEQLQRIPNRGLGYWLLLYYTKDAKIVEKLGAFCNCDVLFNYVGQQGVYNRIDLFQPAFEYTTGANPQNRRDFLLYCAAVIVENRLVVSWEYSENIHKRATIKRVAQDFIETLRSLVACCEPSSNEELPVALEGSS
jgi:non-ribosomal peptide synthase protein (TIGR01720 family)